MIASLQIKIVKPLFFKNLHTNKRDYQIYVPFIIINSLLFSLILPFQIHIFFFLNLLNPVRVIQIYTGVGTSTGVWKPTSSCILTKEWSSLPWKLSTPIALQWRVGHGDLPHLWWEFCIVKVLCREPYLMCNYDCTSCLLTLFPVDRWNVTSQFPFPVTMPSGLLWTYRSLDAQIVS